MKLSKKTKFTVLFNILLMLITQPADAQTANAQPEPAAEIIRFVVLGDNTGDAQPGIHQQIINEIVRLHPDFVIGVGDMIEGYSNDTTLLNQQWDDYFDMLTPLTQPFFYTPGNHDITFDGMQETFEKRVGQPYYSTDWNGLHIVVLDNARQNVIAEFPEEQFKWLEADLKENTDAGWTLVFMHKPFWYATLADNKPDRLHDLFVKYGVEAVFTGHFHMYFSAEYDNILYTAVGSSGGGAGDYSFGLKYHYTWVTLDSTGVHIAPIDIGSTAPWEIQTAAEARAKNSVENRTISSVEQLLIPADLKPEAAPFSITLTNTKPELTTAGSLEWELPEGWSITPAKIEYELVSDSPVQLAFVATCSGDLYPVPTAKTILPYAADKTTILTLSLPCAREVSSVNASSPPTIDGKLDEACWSKATSSLFAPDGTESVCDPTEIFFSYDSDNLYVAARCQESEIDKLAATMTDHDNAVYGEDCFGFMFAPNGEKSPAYQVYINPLGTVYDQKIFAGSDGYWNSDHSVDIELEVKTNRGDNFWSVEVRIPLDQFDTNLKAGDRWPLAFRRKQARLASSAGLVIPWTYNPSKYGQLVFE